MKKYSWDYNEVQEELTIWEDNSTLCTISQVENIIVAEDLFYEVVFEERGIDLKGSHNVETAKDLINEFCLNEFQCEADFSDIENIGVCYSTAISYISGEEDYEIQVNIDLVHYAVKFYIDNKLQHTDRYDNLYALIEQELSNLSFDDLYSRACDYVEET